MAALAGRNIRIKYDSDGAGGGSAVVIAGAKVDTGAITREGIDITDKGDAGVRTFHTDVGTWAMDMTITGIFKDDTLIALAAGATTFTAAFELDIGTIGTFTGNFGITNFEISGEEGATPCTFTCGLASSGAIPYVAD